MEYPNKTKTQRPNEPFSDTLLLLLLLFNGWQIRSTADEFIMSSGRRRLQAALIMHEMQRLSSTSLSVWIKRRTSFRSTPVECVALVGLVCFVFVFFVFFIFDLIRFPPQRKSIKKSPGPISVTLFLTIFKNNKINLWTFDEINATGELNRKKIVS